MTIKRFGDYDKTQGYGDYVPLPKGAYIVKIMGATVKQNSIGQYVEVSCDIAEGEYKDYYTNDYKNQSGNREDKKWHCIYLLNVPNDDGSEKDGWTKRRFKTFTEALEDSNTGYHFDWDEQKFKGKLIGGLFNEREYEKSDGTIGKATNMAQVCAVSKVREGKYRIPPDKLLNKGGKPSPTQASNDGFMTIPEGIEDELPF